LFINVVIVKVQHHNPGVAMQNPIRSRKLIYALGAAAGFLIATAWVLYAVFTSTSSTAPIGLILIPIYGVMAALIGCAVVYVGFVAVDVIAGRLNWGSVRVLTASAFVAVAVLFGGAVFLYRDALAIAENPQSPPAELMAVSQRWIPLWRMEVFLALAKNPATPGVLLTAMSEQKESPALVSMIGANPGTPVATLEKIVAGSRSYERVAGGWIFVMIWITSCTRLSCWRRWRVIRPRRSRCSSGWRPGTSLNISSRLQSFTQSARPVRRLRVPVKPVARMRCCAAPRSRS
jgi:hypothetical protein